MLLLLLLLLLFDASRWTAREKDRIQQIRVKIHAARVIQRCYRRFKLRGGCVNSSPRAKTDRHTRRYKVITSPRTMSGAISSPTSVVKSPTPSAVHHRREVTEAELIRSMTATVKKPLVTAENKIYGTTSVGPRFKKKAPIVAKMVTMHTGYKTYPAFEPAKLPKSKFLSTDTTAHAHACGVKWPGSKPARGRSRHTATVSMHDDPQ